MLTLYFYHLCLLPFELTVRLSVSSLEMETLPQNAAENRLKVHKINKYTALIGSQHTSVPQTKIH